MKIDKKLIKELKEYLEEFGLSEKQTYLDFAKRVNSVKDELYDFIKQQL